MVTVVYQVRPQFQPQLPVRGVLSARLVRTDCDSDRLFHAPRGSDVCFRAPHDVHPLGVVCDGLQQADCRSDMGGSGWVLQLFRPVMLALRHITVDDDGVPLTPRDRRDELVPEQFPLGA